MDKYSFIITIRVVDVKSEERIFLRTAINTNSESYRRWKTGITEKLTAQILHSKVINDCQLKYQVVK